MKMTSTNKRKYSKQNKLLPSLLSNINEKHNLKYDMDIPISIIKDPNDPYWKDISHINHIDAHTYYNNYLKLYFRKQNKDWSTEKEKELIYYINEKRSWLEIAFLLNKHPHKCMKKYLKLTEIKLKWTYEEDKALLDAVDKFGIGKWKCISNYIENRSADQCLQRYKKISGSIKKGRWSDKEDQALLEAVELYKNKGWKYISKYVKGRSDIQCRERYVRALDPKINRSLWSEEEDKKLVNLVNIYGTKWSQVSSKMFNRTDKQCKVRYKHLTKK